MKRIIKVLALLMCLFITIFCTACAPTKGVGLMASKILLNSEYNVQISTVNYLGSVIEFKEDAILLNATTNLTKPIKMILLKNNEDFKNVKEKINEIRLYSGCRFLLHRFPERNYILHLNRFEAR